MATPLFSTGFEHQAPFTTNEGETISAHTITVPDGITVDSSTVIKNDTAVSVWLSGGTDGDDYIITCEIETSGNRTAIRSAIIPVRKR
jgi:hypothetical protein